MAHTGRLSEELLELGWIGLNELVARYGAMDERIIDRVIALRSVVAEVVSAREALAAREQVLREIADKSPCSIKDSVRSHHRGVFCARHKARAALAGAVVEGAAE